MGFTSRRKRPLDRHIPHLRDTRLIIIVTEGQKTEKQYFESEMLRYIKILLTKLSNGQNHWMKTIQVLAGLRIQEPMCIRL